MVKSAPLTGYVVFINVQRHVSRLEDLAYGSVRSTLEPPGLR